MDDFLGKKYNLPNLTQKEVESLKKPLTINISSSFILFPYPQDARKLKIILQMNFSRS